MHRAYTPVPTYVFMAWSSVKHRDNSTFTLLYKRKKSYRKDIQSLTYKYPQEWVAAKSCVLKLVRKWWYMD
jgi:hypothetical protein